MKCVILAGGNGTRLAPLTYAVNKHLLPIGKKPMILYPLDILIRMGFQEVCIVSSVDGKQDLIKFFEKYPIDIKVKFRNQYNADGIAGAIKCCEDYIDKEDFLVILGDNIFFEPPNIDGASGCRIFAYYVDDVSQFGQIFFDEDNKVTKIVEKSGIKEPGFIATGVYYFSSQVFEIIENLKKSDRGEYEVTDINNEFIKRGMIDCRKIKGKWIDAGTFDDYFKANVWTR